MFDQLKAIFKPSGIVEDQNQRLVSLTKRTNAKAYRYAQYIEGLITRDEYLTLNTEGK